MSKFLKIATLAAIAVAAPSVAMAHTGVAPHDHGLAAGFAHPFTGLDHLVVMLGVGLLSARIGGRALWLAPLSFLAMMAVGGVTGANGVSLPFAETAIAASAIGVVLALGLRWRPSAIVAGVVSGAFAFFHGHAHGAEMAQDAQFAAYALGFMSATALLIAMGAGLGLAAERSPRKTARRV